MRETISPGVYSRGKLPQEPLNSPAAERNKEPILAVLASVLPDAGLVLEVASGTGQHIVHFARALSHLTWQPSDPDGESLRSIAAYIDVNKLDNVAEPLDLDVLGSPWPVASADAVLCSNMIHIAPWSATEGLLRGSGELLCSGAPLVLYGPFRRDGQHTSASNEVFDASLKARDPDWGIRDLEQVTELASRHGFFLDEIVAMPANNLTVVFRKSN